jgi:hypothetical protein
LAQEIIETKKTDEEDYDSFAVKIGYFVTKGYPDTPEIEDIKIEHFLNGIKNDIAEQVRKWDSTTLKDAVHKAKLYTPESGKR